MNILEIFFLSESYNEVMKHSIEYFIFIKIENIILKLNSIKTILFNHVFFINQHNQKFAQKLNIDGFTFQKPF